MLEENVISSAGARHRSNLAELIAMIRTADRIPAQRDTLYTVLRRYDGPDDEASPLDAVTDAESRFGSYRRLIASGEFRYTRR
jgi:hypothetical protein